MTKFEILQKQLKGKAKKNITLANFTTFKIGGPARYFFVAKNKYDIIKAINVAKKLSIPYFILGGGSNLLVSDQGFWGLVIKIHDTKYKIQDTKIIASAGISLSKLIQIAALHSLSGLEYFAGLPGTLGGAIYGNAGWSKEKYSIGNLVEEVELLMPNGSIRKKRKDWLKFRYRHSRLSDFNPSKRPIILSAVLKLKPKNHSKIQQKIKEIIISRSKKIPKGNSAGCIFKNVNINELLTNCHKSNKKNFVKIFGQTIPVFDGQIPAGWLIEQCGLKGKILGGAKISEQHANFIINVNHAKALDVLKLIKLIKFKVYKKFKIKLCEEIQQVGFK